VAVLTHLPVADARAEVGGGGQPIVVIVGRGTLVRLLVDVVRQVLMLCRRTAAVVAEDAARDGDEVGAGLATLAAPTVNVPNVAGHDDSKFRKKIKQILDTPDHTFTSYPNDNLNNLNWNMKPDQEE